MPVKRRRSGRRSARPPRMMVWLTQGIKMKLSMHLRVAVLIAHVALCTAIVLEAAQSDGEHASAAMSLLHPDHR